ncbi:hypothetical protein M5X02_30160 [Paenibacillus alvei]|uniref:hypothetical protein n=1 Tax=Paenibacillus alvei TaxID=44250 RepID=UPI000288CB9B|nr:hypothetical protein [Paenibacillus alvei]EJW14053.1 hypothetical protein PAV_141p01590 [Paenibacillus alvei DSM 29]MCY9544894.1 hypothetical protein [Paenibacillus alvei]MCY9707795.1 hypothetical protein [Paenibacillus alvei]MEC0082693.1 hypothetical protein [Paenibacillus alvei]
MKKLITSIIIAIIFFVGAGVTNANATDLNTCEIQLQKPIHHAEIVMTTEKVKSVFYEKGWYYLETYADDEGGTWVLEIGKEPKSAAKLDKLKKQYTGKLVDVQYTGDYEYLGWNIHK